MAIKFVEKIFGSHSQRELKMILPLVDKVESLRPQMQSLSDEELRGRHRNIRRDTQMASHWILCSRKRMRRCVKQQSVF